MTEETKNVMDETVETVDTEEVAEETVAEESVESHTEDATTEETTTEETAGSTKGSKKENLFKKKKDKRDEQIAELNDRVVRQMAEFDNFRKRTEKEKSMMFDMGAKNIIEKILPIIDNFERGFLTVEEADKEDAFVQGMAQVYKQLMKEFTMAVVLISQTQVFAVI